jgi:hypothetical protein
VAVVAGRRRAGRRLLARLLLCIRQDGPARTDAYGGIVCVLVVGHAGAEPVDPAARTRSVPVWFVDNSGVKPFVDVYADGAEVGKARALASCRPPCGFRMAQGRYVLHAGETDDTFDGHRHFVVERRRRRGEDRLLGETTENEHCSGTAFCARYCSSPSGESTCTAEVQQIASTDTPSKTP